MKILNGVDIIEIDRIEKVLKDCDKAFRDRVFTSHEIEYCENRKASRYKSYAARFAAKEAVSKALGTGIAHGLSLKEIEVRNTAEGKPQVLLSGNAKELYDSLNPSSMDISLSHCENYAVAYVTIIIG